MNAKFKEAYSMTNKLNGTEAAPSHLADSGPTSGAQKTKSGGGWAGALAAADTHLQSAD